LIRTQYSAYVYERDLTERTDGKANLLSVTSGTAGRTEKPHRREQCLGRGPW